MQMKPYCGKGVSLVELMVGLAIMALLMSLAQPSFSEWMGDLRIRTTAEAMQNGLQFAQSQAVSRNTQVRFSLTDTLASGCVRSVQGQNWVVSLDDPERACHSEPSEEAAPRILQVRPAIGAAQLSTEASADELVFNGLGRPDGALSIDVRPLAGRCRADGGSARCLRIMVSTVGEIRSCDPSLGALGGDSRRC